MKTLKFFIPIIWVIIYLFLSGHLLDLMNMSNSIAFTLGFLGMVLITYLSFRTRLGIKLITKK